MIKVFTGFFLVLAFLSCTQQSEKTFSLPEYGEKDFEMVKKLMHNDSALMQKMEEGVANGDTTAMQAQWLLNATFEEAMNHPEISKEQIMAMIHSVVMMKEVRTKFEDINQRLEKLNGGDVNRKTDSLIRYLDSLSAEIRKNGSSSE